jgi:hypothetical protein
MPYQPEVDDRVAGEPEERAREQRIGAGEDPERPGEEEAEHRDRERQRGDHPHRVGDERHVREQRHALAGVSSPPADVRDEDVRGDQPGADHQQRGAEVERPVRLERRVHRVEDVRPAGEHREAGEADAEQQRRERGGDESANRRHRQAARGGQRDEAVREREGEHERVQHAVRGESLVVRPHSREVLEDVDVGVVQRLAHAVHDAEEEREEADVDRPGDQLAVGVVEREPFGPVDDRVAHWTITFPYIVWCATPQYS